MKNNTLSNRGKANKLFSGSLEKIAVTLLATAITVTPILSSCSLKNAGSVGIIGGADGSTSIYIADKDDANGSADTPTDANANTSDEKETSESGETEQPKTVSEEETPLYTFKSNGKTVALDASWKSYVGSVEDATMNTVTVLDGNGKSNSYQRTDENCINDGNGLLIGDTATVYYIGEADKPEIKLIITERANASEKVTLYFSDSNCDYMLKEERVVFFTPEDEAGESVKPIETAIIEALVEGPRAKDRQRAISDDIKVLSTKVENGVCYADLSREFAEKNSQGTAGGSMAIGTVVTSLCERENIDSVVLLSEGEVITEFGGHFEFTEPIKPWDRIQDDGLESSALDK